MTETIRDKTFDEERALYHLQDAAVEHCVFAGPADGESALKEARRIQVRDCDFSLRYPLWHVDTFTAEGCRMDGDTRAALWYSVNGEIRDSRLEGIKCLRECADVTLRDCVIRSAECGWRCRRLNMEDVTAESEYFLMGTRQGILRRLRLTGKYSFQYTEDLLIEDAVLDTKDAFWHSRGVTVRNSVINGEYLGWYSEGLTLTGCRIIGTQPLCYCRGLRLEDCTMEQADLSFECSEVFAQVRGDILSIKNPRAGRIVADSIGEVILRDPVMETDCTVLRRGETE